MDSECRLKAARAQCFRVGERGNLPGAFGMRASDSEGFRLVVRGGRPKQGSSSHRPGLSEYCGPPSKDIVATIQSTR